MAVTATNQVTKAKLVFQVENEEGEMRQTSRTFSNLVPNVGNDALHAGMSAVAGLMEVTAVSEMRDDHRALETE